MKKSKPLLRIVVFSLLLALVVCGLQGFLSVDNRRAFANQRGFYQEKRNSLDAVFIGSSNVHNFWQPLYAWEDHGIAVWPFSVDTLPAKAMKYMILEARKTQPDALYIVNINCFHSMTLETPVLHRTLDYLPYSLNRLNMTDMLLDEAEIKGLDRLEFYFPIIRSHSRWSELQSWSFDGSGTRMKASVSYYRFFKNIEDVSDVYQPTEERSALPEEQRSIVEDLLDFCEKEQIKVLFVSVPQPLGTELAASDQTAREINAIADLVQSRGFPCLHLLGKAEELGIQTDTDYFDWGHTNIHGSAKFTEYLSQALIDRYHFADKRGQSGWKSWDEAAQDYADLTAPWCLPFERAHAARDYGLAAPKLSKLKIDGQTITLTWSESDGAERYEIFRKADNGESSPWQSLAVVDQAVLSYVDAGLEPETAYTYTVVPCRDQGADTVYGCFSYSGVSGTTKGE